MQYYKFNDQHKWSRPTEDLRKTWHTEKWLPSIWYFPCDPNNIDFTNCLGKEHNGSENSQLRYSEGVIEDRLNQSLTFREFYEVVGDERISKFKKIANLVEWDENSEKWLYELFAKKNEKYLEEIAPL